MNRAGLLSSTSSTCARSPTDIAESTRFAILRLYRRRIVLSGLITHCSRESATRGSMLEPGSNSLQEEWIVLIISIALGSLGADCVLDVSGLPPGEKISTKHRLFLSDPFRLLIVSLPSSTITVATPSTHGLVGRGSSSTVITPSTSMAYAAVKRFGVPMTRRT